MKTVDCLKLLHGVHAHFLLAGDSNTPIIHQVHRIRDGKSFATGRVDAITKGINIFTLLASFKKKEEGSVHHQATMPSVPVPDTLLSMEELHEKRLLDLHLPRMQFHRPVRANDWLLYVMVSPIAYDTRGFVSGQMSDRNGELIASLTQDSLNRPIRPTPAAASSCEPVGGCRIL